MKNKEKYIDEILEIIVGDVCLAVDKKTNKPVACRGFECTNCLFNNCCRSEIKRDWLEAEYQEFIKLTDDEIVILKNIDKKYKLITRYKDGNLFLYVDKQSCIAYGLKAFSHLFQSIKLEDEEPYSIDELLKQNGVER